MRFICPLITVKNMEASRQFYVDVLKQKVRYDFGANIEFEGNFAIHLKPHFAGLIGMREAELMEKPNNAELYFEEDNLEAFMQTLKGRDIDFLHEVREQPWGQRVTRFYDPDGHIIEVGESMESVVRRLLKQGLTVEETAKRTSMPLEFVKGCVEK